MTSYEMSELFDKQLRISKSGLSVKCGERIVAKCPIAYEEIARCGEKFERWMEDAERMCDAWNARADLIQAKQDAYAKGFNRGQGSMPWPIGSPGYLTSMAIDLGEE